MSERPEGGVVDKHCKVHGAANLYVAGSSVVPTTGQERREALTRWERSAIEDFEADGAVPVAGWQLARTECRLCGLAYPLLFTRPSVVPGTGRLPSYIAISMPSGYK